MQVKEKQWEQFVPVAIDRVWAFFSRPENLDTITPDDLSFEILSDVAGVSMYEGMIIRYQVSPLFGIKLPWVTEITHISEPNYFIDEQRFGPYAFWHHQHHFEEVDGGTLMRDILHYKVPFGPLGNLVDALLVDRRIEEIFTYRFQAVEKWVSQLKETSTM